jgi:hypothetical protein
LRRVGVVLPLVLVAGAVGRTDRAAADFSSAQIIAALNRQREANGIPPVRDTKWRAAAPRMSAM